MEFFLVDFTKPISIISSLAIIWNNILYLRTGKYINHDTASFTFGGGLDYELSRYKFSINYAYSNYSILDNTHQFGINFGF